jgi:hypothetical protein
MIWPSLVPPTLPGWHAGASRLDRGERILGINSFSISDDFVATRAGRAPQRAYRGFTANEVNRFRPAGTDTTDDWRLAIKRIFQFLASAGFPNCLDGTSPTTTRALTTRSDNGADRTASPREGLVPALPR